MKTENPKSTGFRPKSHVSKPTYLPSVCAIRYDMVLHPISMMKMFWVVLQDFFHIFPAEGCLVPHGKIRHLRELEEQHVLEE